LVFVSTTRRIAADVPSRRGGDRRGFPRNGCAGAAIRYD
jgi:hypothetical protein